MTSKRQNHTIFTQAPSMSNGGIFEIKIKGLLDDHWGQWFDGLTLERQENVDSGQDCTLIIGPMADQPALHGLLAKIRDLNLTLISVRKLDSKEPLDHEVAQDDINKESSPG